MKANQAELTVVGLTAAFSKTRLPLEKGPGIRPNEPQESLGELSYKINLSLESCMVRRTYSLAPGQQTPASHILPEAG